MTTSDGDEKFSSTQSVTSDKMNKVVMWHGTTIPTNPNNEIPNLGLFLKTDSGEIYENEGTEGSPNFVLKMAGGAEEKQVYPYSIVKGDYTIPTNAVATSEIVSDFFEQYTTNTGWTPVGSNVTVDDAVADVCRFAAATADDNRVHKALGFTLSDSLWIYETEMIFAFSASLDVIPFCLSAGTGAPTTASQDAIIFFINGGTPNMIVSYKDGAAGLANGTGTPVTFSASTQYYLRLERTSTTNIKISIFTDAARTTHEGNSPQNFTIPSTVGGLTTLQHGVRDTASGATVTGTIDNSFIQDNASSIANFPATNVLTDNTTDKWKTASVAAPAIYVDMNGAEDGAAILFNIDKTDTTITEVTLRASTDITFASSEDVRTVLVADLDDDSDEFYRFDRLDVDKQYYQLIGTGTGVLVMNKLFVLTPSDYARRHRHKDISVSDTSLDGEGS